MLEKNFFAEKKFSTKKFKKRSIFVKIPSQFFYLILWAFEIKTKKGEKKLHISFSFRAPYMI